MRPTWPSKKVTQIVQVIWPTFNPDTISITSLKSQCHSMSKFCRLNAQGLKIRAQRTKECNRSCPFLLATTFISHGFIMKCRPNISTNYHWFSVVGLLLVGPLSLGRRLEILASMNAGVIYFRILQRIIENLLGRTFCCRLNGSGSPYVQLHIWFLLKLGHSFR